MRKPPDHPRTRGVIMSPAYLDLAPNLFGEVCVLRTWDRIGTQGRAMIETCYSQAAAQVSATRLVRAKLRRGYLTVGP